MCQVRVRCSGSGAYQTWPLFSGSSWLSWGDMCEHIFWEHTHLNIQPDVWQDDKVMLGAGSLLKTALEMSQIKRDISHKNCARVLKVVESWGCEGWMEAWSRGVFWGQAGERIMWHLWISSTFPLMGHQPSFCHWGSENNSDSDNSVCGAWVSPRALRLPSPYQSLLRDINDCTWGRQEERELKISITVPREIKWEHEAGLSSCRRETRGYPAHGRVYHQIPSEETPSMYIWEEFWTQKGVWHQKQC